MTDNIQHIDVDDEMFDGTPKALRDYVKKLQKQNSTLVTERDGAIAQVRSRAVADVLTGKGFKNPKRVEKDLLNDGVDPTDKEAVDGWLAEFGDDYAKGEAPAPAPVQTADQTARNQLNVAAEVKDPSSLTPFELAQQEITPDMTGAQVTAVYAKYGV